MTRLVFMDLLILCDQNGVVDMTHEAIARRTNVPIETIRKAITELEGPDPRSRSTRENGARIKRLDEHRDWGWFLVNHDIYRGIASDDQYRQKARERMRKLRAKEASPTPPEENKDSTHTHTQCSKSCSPCNATVTQQDYATNPPTETEFLKEISMVAMPEAEKIKCFHHFNGQGWKKGMAKTPITNLRSIAESWRSDWEAKRGPNGSGSSVGPGGCQETAGQLAARKRAVDESLQAIRARGFEDAMGLQIKPEDKDEYKRLSKIRRELNAKLVGV